MDKFVLVTGADGFLGSNIVRELLSRGKKVRAFIRKGSTQKTLKGLAVELFYGDLLELDSLIEAAKDCGSIIHAAALTDVWPTRGKMYHSVNYEGTKNVIEASKRNNVQRNIFVGTANSFGFGCNTNPGDEKNPYRSAKYRLDYMDSKYKAQQLVLNEVKTSNFPALMVNPTFMIGPFDSKPSSGEMIIAIYKRKLPGYPKGGKNYIYVKDVAEAICNALTMGRIGECYILGNQNLSYKEMFNKISVVLQVKGPALEVPSFLTKSFGFTGSMIGKIRGKRPSVSYPLSRISCENHFYTAEKARRELNLNSTPIEIAIESARHWFVENGYIGSK